MLQRFKNSLIAAGVDFYAEEEEQPKGFTWLFLGTYPGQKCRPAVLRAEASSEEEARQDLAQRMGDSWSFIFAAKLRQGCPLYRYSSGAFELDVQALAGGRHE
ncbi:host cell division inhibitor Icd-like protein [Salmonella enterica subsp. enterica]|nr:host cell division inhibitor Icd-like protein [Salmonella enterica subsp. enterica serovar Agbeni]